MSGRIDVTGLDYLDEFAILIAADQIELQAASRFGFGNYEIESKRIGAGFSGLSADNEPILWGILLRAGGIAYIWRLKSATFDLDKTYEQLLKDISGCNEKRGSQTTETGWRIPKSEEPIPAGYSVANEGGLVSAVDPGQYIIVGSSNKFAGVLQYTTRRDETNDKPNFEVAVEKRAQQRIAARQARITKALNGAGDDSAAAAPSRIKEES